MPPLLASFFLVLRGQEENVCTDVPFKNGTVWTDHLLRPCSFYAENHTARCTPGTKAAIMCCACGGGTATSPQQALVVSSTILVGCNDYPGWKDTDDYGCDRYDQPEYNSECDNDYHTDSAGVAASDACCSCGGGCLDKPFANGTQWNDGNPISQSCDQFTVTSCGYYGESDNDGDGTTAKQMCCVCGGGSNVKDGTTAPPLPTTTAEDDDDALVIGLSVGGGVLAIALGAWAYRTYGNSKFYSPVASTPVSL